jgi:hypothetical protein
MKKMWIPKGVKTAGHAKWLRDHGYTVEEDEKKITFEVTSIIAEADLGEDPTSVLKDIVAKKQAFTYRSKVKVDGKVKWSVPLCLALGSASALIAYPQDAADEVGKKAAPKKDLGAF